MKKIAILGSTGSIGTQTLEVIRNNPELQVVALAAGKSVEQMEQQIREFHPLIAGMWSEEAAADLREPCGGFTCESRQWHGWSVGDRNNASVPGISDGDCGNDWYQTDDRGH